LIIEEARVIQPSLRDSIPMGRVPSAEALGYLHSTSPRSITHSHLKRVTLNEDMAHFYEKASFGSAVSTYDCAAVDLTGV
jgi:hypothetical protein